MKDLAELLGVSESSIRRWLNFFEKKQWIERPRRYGGAGKGNVIVMVWVQRGVELYERRKRALNYQKEKRERYEQNRENYKRLSQETNNTTTPNGDLKNRAMRDARMALKRFIKKTHECRHAASAFGQWVKQHQPTIERVNAIVDRLRALKQLPKPKWVKSPSDIYRWIRGLIFNLLVHPNWEAKFEARLEMKLCHKQLRQIEQSVMDNSPCPICSAAHSKADFEHGCDEKGRTNCIGWVRLRRADAGEIWRRDLGGLRVAEI